jgi:hypothetical protein
VPKSIPHACTTLAVSCHANDERGRVGDRALGRVGARHSCGIVLCCAVLCCVAVRCGAVRCVVEQCAVLWCGAVRCGVEQCLRRVQTRNITIYTEAKINLKMSCATQCQSCRETDSNWGPMYDSFWPQCRWSCRVLALCSCVVGCGAVRCNTVQSAPNMTIYTQANINWKIAPNWP